MRTTDPTIPYRFGRFELQRAERRLLADGVAAGIGPRAFDLLVALVERAGHLVSKDTLFAEVWPHVVVDDSALQFQMSSLRKLLGKDAIATVSGRGYRFMWAVTRVDDAAAHSQAARHNLPAAPSSFVGREPDIVRLLQALDRARLVTLTGAGGCGKTRLALEVAHRAGRRYPGGVWIVELAALTDPTLLLQAVVSALDLSVAPGASPLQALATRLGPRTLLLLDNAEHLRDACGALCDTLLRECEGVGLLVTSRQALGAVGELTCRVPSLSLPDSRLQNNPEQLLASESARLFVERARLLRPHFTVTPDNAQALALVCWRLDGIPLAIELAAGRLRSMTLEELSQRLNQRFSLLSGGAHTVLPRHRTLRSLIDWSYDLLSSAEQALLCRLSVFAGGCSLQAAEQVCSDAGADTAQVLDLLAALSDKSLLVIDEPADDGGATRYRLLETVRQYAAERLRDTGQTPTWQHRHRAFFTALADAAQPQLEGPDQGLWFDRLEADHDNLRAALRWSMTADSSGEAGLQLANALARFWLVRGLLAEGRAWFQTLLALPAGSDFSLRGQALNLAGIFASQQVDFAAARPLFEAALAALRTVGDLPRVAAILSNLGSIAADQGDHGLALAFYEDSVAMLRRTGRPTLLARALANLASFSREQNDNPKAWAMLTEALSIARAEGDRHGAAMTLCTLGGFAGQQGRLAEARAMLLEALAIHFELGDRRAMADALEELASHASMASTRSLRLWGAAAQLRDTVGAPLPPSELPEYSRRVAAVRATLADDTAFDAAWQQGRSMSLEEAVRCASAPDI